MLCFDESGWRVQRATLVCFTIVALVGIVLTAPTVQADEDVVVRVFRIEHLKVAEVSAAIQPMLSDEGSVTVEPSKGRLVVRDRAAVMAVISEAVERLDHKPLPFRIRVELLEGSQTQVSMPGIQEVGQRLKKMFPFKFYRGLGSMVLGGVTGDEITVDLDENYKILVTVLDHRLKPTAFGIPNQGLRLELQPLVLVRSGPKGAKEILRTRVVVSQNQEVVIGAGENEDSDRGLVLIVKALPEG